MYRSDQNTDIESLCDQYGLTLDDRDPENSFIGLELAYDELVPLTLDDFDTPMMAASMNYAYAEEMQSYINSQMKFGDTDIVTDQQTTSPTIFDTPSSNIGSSRFSDVDGEMRILTQPRQNQRWRYPVDGKRYLEGLRNHPIQISLPDLSSVATNHDEKLGLLVNVVTTNENPEHQRCIHVNKLCCGIDDAETLDEGTFIPLTLKHINDRRIQIRKIGIINKKLNEYPIQLAVFDSTHSSRMLVPSEVEEFDASQLIQQAKRLDNDFNLGTCQIIFQIALVGAETRVISPFMCLTNTMEEI